MTSERSTRGRPRRARAPREPRSFRITVRFSASEHARLVERAALAGLSLSQCLRASDPKIPAPRRSLPPVAHEILGELRRIGNNVNQAVRLCHQGRIPPELLPHLVALEASLKTFGALLVGDGSRSERSTTGAT